MSAGLAAAVADGVGHRATQSSQIGTTRATGVCCNMNSLTKICHGVTSGFRQGRSRLNRSYQSRSSLGVREGFTAACGTMNAMPNSSPVAAWKALKEGNERFVAGRPQHPSQSVEHRASLANGQKPTVALFGCGDSRVAAELIFDQGLGNMFVVRTAGHVIDSAVLGSIEFAVTVLGVPLIVVLGHDSCGAVKATMAALDGGALPGGYVRDVIERVTPSILLGRREGLSRADEFEARHVVETGAQLLARSTAIAERVAAGELAIVGATYHLAEGRVVLRQVIGDVGEEPGDES
jgi:carbonic anhydrase